MAVLVLPAEAVVVLTAAMSGRGRGAAKKCVSIIAVYHSEKRNDSVIAGQHMEGACVWGIGESERQGESNCGKLNRITPPPPNPSGGLERDHPEHLL